MNNYCPISKLSVLGRILESQVNLQLKQFLLANNNLSDFHSVWRTGHNTITAAMAVTNNLIGASDRKQYCAALFVDLSKAFG